jgi:hypothetical protein
MNDDFTLHALDTLAAIFRLIGHHARLHARRSGTISSALAKPGHAICSAARQHPGAMAPL